MLQREAVGQRLLPWGQLRKRLFGLSPGEAKFTRRGFRACDQEAQWRLEHIGETFLRGYEAALEEEDSAALAGRLEGTAAEFRGFAFEGAAMGLSLLDMLTPWRRDRWLSFTNEFGSPHIYMMHVGVGWVLARLRRRAAPRLSRLDPLLRWLALDGYGFHEGYFRWQLYIEGQKAPRRLGGYARRAFDQGLGRSIWFVRGANPGLIPRTIASFPPTRRADLWSGIGLACAYAGGADGPGVAALSEAAGLYRAHLAQGAAFAAKTRQRAGNPAPHTELACQALCGCSAETAAGVTDDCLRGLPGDGQAPAYEHWRQRIQATFAREVMRA